MGSDGCATCTRLACGANKQEVTRGTVRGGTADMVA